MNTSGVETAELRYKAFGQTRYTSGATLTKRQYTGQVSEAELGLYFYASRYYDPSLGRFVQPDSIIPSGSVIAFDRYAYVFNSPINYIDPTGHLGTIPSDANDTPDECGPDGIYCLPEDYFNWDPNNVQFMSQTDKEKAEAAYYFFVENPDYFINLYLYSSSLDNSDLMLAYLDLYFRYSSERSTAEIEILTLLPTEVVDNISDASFYYRMGDGESGTAFLFLALSAIEGGSSETCPVCGTFRPDVARSQGRLRIDSDGASLWYANCLKSGKSMASAGKYWIKSFQLYVDEAAATGLGPPKWTGPGAHFSVFSGGPQNTSSTLWQRLNQFIRTGAENFKR